jgi:hypothetical protein
MIIEGDHYLSNPPAQPQKFIRPSIQIWIRNGENERLFDRSKQNFLESVSNWMQMSIDGRWFTDLDDGEILDWRSLREGHKYEVRGQRAMPVKVLVGETESRVTIDTEGDLGAQWHAIARKLGAGSPFEILRGGSRIEPVDVRMNNQVELKPLWDRTITLQSETDERSIHFQSENENQLRAKVHSFVKGAVLYQRNPRIGWGQTVNGETYQAMQPIEEHTKKGTFIYGNTERDIEFRNERDAWIQLNNWAGKNLALIEEGSNQRVTPREVRADQKYFVVPQEDQRGIRLDWDDSEFEVPKPKDHTVFWNDIRNYVDSWSLRIRGSEGWCDPFNAEVGKLYTVHRHVKGQTLLEVEVVRRGKSIKFDAMKVNPLTEIKKAFGEGDWWLIGPGGRRRTTEQMRDGCVYEARLPGEEEDPMPDLPLRSKFTRQRGQSLIRFQVEIRDELHELFIREGDRRTLTDIIIALAGTTKVEFPEGKPSLDWEGKTITCNTRGEADRIPFYLTLPTGEKTSETIKIHGEKGKSIGWVRDIAKVRWGIQDCTILRAPQTITEDWRDKFYKIHCRMKGGDPNHFSNESAGGLEKRNAIVVVSSQIHNNSEDQRTLLQRSQEGLVNQITKDDINDRSTDDALGSTVVSQGTETQPHLQSINQDVHPDETRRHEREYWKPD